MNEIDLKAYTFKAMELESAIYTQKKMMEEHQKIIKSERPLAPKKPNFQVPTKPVKPVENPKENNVVLWVVGGLSLFGCIIFITALPGLGILMLIACCYGFFNILSSRNRDIEKNKNAISQYKLDMDEYNRILEQNKNNYKKANMHYTNALQKYTQHIDEYDEKSTKITQKHAEVLASLENALEEFYKQNVIFPKYRNMVAITAINEYLMSGRCFELEGSNGAYNLYEMELRQNIVIGQLSSIINNLEQIKNNQFTLYQELSKANETVNDVLKEVRGVNENTKLTAYFAGVSAIIEATPKVYIGHNF